MVIVRIWEGLGNQLFQYAYARALKERGYEVSLDLNKTYDDSFEKYDNHSPRTNSIQNYNLTIPQADTRSIRRYRYLSKRTTIDKTINHMALKGAWFFPFYEETTQAFSEKSFFQRHVGYIKGWFQDERYFKDIRSILLSELAPKESMDSDLMFQSIVRERNSISVHFRRGDYVRIGHALNEFYYTRAIDALKKYCDNPVFYVFSDDIKWVKRYIDFGSECVFVNEDKKFMDYQELYMMSKCKYNIISNSTFSWWGAWLNDHPDKVVIAPSKWFSGQKRIVPKEWVIV